MRWRTAFKTQLLFSVLPLISEREDREKELCFECGSVAERSDMRLRRGIAFWLRFGGGSIDTNVQILELCLS